MNMNKLLTLLVGVLIMNTIIGCGTSPMTKQRGEYACKDKGGVYTRGIGKVMCNNGEDLDLPKTIPDEEYWVKPADGSAQECT